MVLDSAFLLLQQVEPMGSQEHSHQTLEVTKDQHLFSKVYVQQTSMDTCLIYAKTFHPSVINGTFETGLH